MKLSIVETSRSIWWNNVSGLYIYIISMRRSGQLWKTKLSRMAVKDLAHGETKGFIFLCVSPFLCVLQQIIAEWLCRAPAVIHHRSAHPNIHSLRKEKCGFWHQPVTRGTVHKVKGQRAAVTNQTLPFACGICELVLKDDRKFVFASPPSVLSHFLLSVNHLVKC